MFFLFAPFISSSIYAALLLVSLYYSSSRFFWWGLIAGICILLFSIKRSAGRISYTLSPILLVLSGLPLISLIDDINLRYSIIVTSSISLHALLIAKNKLIEQPKNSFAFSIINLINLGIFFAWSNIIFASYNNFSEVVFPFWIMLLLILFVSLITSKDILEYASKSNLDESPPKRDVNLSAFLIALMSLEIAWAVAFFPLGYRSSAMILFASYYSILASVFFFLTKREKKRKLAKDIIISLIAIVLILITAKWRYY